MGESFDELGPMGAHLTPGDLCDQRIGEHPGDDGAGVLSAELVARRLHQSGCQGRVADEGQRHHHPRLYLRIVCVSVPLEQLVEHSGVR